MSAPAEPKRVATFDPQMTEAVANVLAQTDHPGLSNAEIDSLLQLVRIADRDRMVNKRTSLKVALHNAQVRQQCGNALSAFIARAMHPSRYVGNERRWMQLRDQLNVECHEKLGGETVDGRRPMGESRVTRRMVWCWSLKPHACSRWSPTRVHTGTLPVAWPPMLSKLHPWSSTTPLVRPVGLWPISLPSSPLALKV